MKITATTKLLGLFADPAEHSKSPKIFNAIFDKYGMDYAYLAFRVPKGEIGTAAAAIRVIGMKGANISMPHKEAIIPYLDEISDEARFCGAVNTVVNDNGMLKGYNTDIYGAVKAVESLDVKIDGSKVAILGLGGAGKAVLTGVLGRNPREIRVFVRGIDALKEGKANEAFRAPEAKAFVEKAKEETAASIYLFDLKKTDDLRDGLSDIDILINATGVGMGKYEGESLIPDSSFLNNKPAVLDVIYAPEKTRLLEQAEEAGCRFSNGLSMLAYQGEIAFKLMLGREITINDVREAIDA
ncbi:MAG: shikimate dehydrogenase [Firmicutes bacterium]|nr:shikimate dehydrogenase [Bacillota bacterium]